MGQSSYPLFIMVLTVPLLFLLVALCSANTGGEYDYQEEESPSEPSEPLQIEALVQQPVPSRIYSSRWANNIPGFGKRSRVYSVVKRTPVALWSGWPKRSPSAMRSAAPPCYANPLSCYSTVIHPN